MIQRRKNLLYDAAAALFILFLAAFAASRARHELRWSGLAFSDSELITSGLHFAQEGYRSHYFLSYYHPGYLGKRTRNESQVGYEPHYPALQAAVNAFWIERFGENLFVLRLSAIAASCLGLWFCYWAFTFFFERPVCLLAVFFIGTSVSFLEFVDSTSLYSGEEFFRFAILLAFLLAERKLDEGRKAWAAALFGAVWALNFLQGMQSNDYVPFAQVFFLAYYLFRSGKRFPALRFCFLVSAAVAALALRLYLNELALGPEEAMKEWSGRSLLSWEKTAPFNKGPLHVLSFVTYFSRIMEGHMVNSNFGFGFGVLFLAAAVVLILPEGLRRDLLPSEAGQRFGLNRSFLVFFLPSAAWWAIFPNHAASFFWMPKHLYPAVGLLLGAGALLSWRAARDPASPRPLKLGAWAAFAGVVWSPLLFSGKYLKEYPNLINPSVRTQMGDWGGRSTEEIGEIVRAFKSLRQATAYGDIVIVCNEPVAPVSSFFEYYAQRRLEYAESPAELEKILPELDTYRKTGKDRYPIFGPVRLYALSRKGADDPLRRYLDRKFQQTSNLGGGWTLWSLEMGRDTH